MFPSTSIMVLLHLEVGLERKKDDSNVATGVIQDVASSSSWSKSICNPKTKIMRNRGPPKIIASLQR